MTASSAASGGEQLLTVPQVAQRLSVSLRKTWRLISEGHLTTVRVGERGTRILVSEVNAYIQRLTPGRA
jgi:excisionase family DNA binding protein